ncbi:MAG: FHA domain-containing protein [Candidatus Omnitrophica bacterium]|nr:FHA domain-containing protein [Candidatus Omnitrophota bacterium]
MAKLVVLSEGFAGRACELKVERTTVGRMDDNLFQIPEPSVSSHHCEILLRGNDVVVRDLNSTNGTYINGEQITESSLKSGQILRLGQVEIRLENGQPAAQTKKVPEPRAQGLPQGVKLDEFDTGVKAVNPATDTLFRKKNNKVNRLLPRYQYRRAGCARADRGYPAGLRHHQLWRHLEPGRFGGGTPGK